MTFLKDVYRVRGESKKKWMRYRRERKSERLVVLAGEERREQEHRLSLATTGRSEAKMTAW